MVLAISLSGGTSAWGAAFHWTGFGWGFGGPGTGTQGWGNECPILKGPKLNYSHALAGARATVDPPMLATAPRSVSPRPSTKDRSKHADLFLLSHVGTGRRAGSALLSSQQGSRATSPLLQGASLGHLCSVTAEKVHLSLFT